MEFDDQKDTGGTPVIQSAFVIIARLVRISGGECPSLPDSAAPLTNEVSGCKNRFDNRFARETQRTKTEGGRRRGGKKFSPHIA